jgi:hypothetical protein
VRASIHSISTDVDTSPVKPAKPVMVAEAERKNGSSNPDESLGSTIVE